MDKKTYDSLEGILNVIEDIQKSTKEIIDTIKMINKLNEQFALDITGIESRLDKLERDDK